MVLMNPGLFTFGDENRTAYERHVELSTGQNAGWTNGLRTRWRSLDSEDEPSRQLARNRRTPQRSHAQAVD